MQNGRDNKFVYDNKILIIININKLYQIKLLTRTFEILFYV